MNATKVQDALRLRHSKDLYISECKNGPTQSIGARPIRLDGWAFVKTWSPVTSIGYEIKVTRGDFLGDHKWSDYRRLCHLFYFVAPKGLIQIAELPEAVGLVEALGGKNGSAVRLVTRRKAARCEPDTDAYLSLLHYVLMCRVRPGGTWVDAPVADIDLSEQRRIRVNGWVEWLETRATAKDVGRRVTAAVRDALDTMKLDRERATALVASYEETRQVLRQLGFDPDVPIGRWGLSDKIERAVDIVRPELVERMRRVRLDLDYVLAGFEGIFRRYEEAQAADAVARTVDE